MDKNTMFLLLGVAAVGGGLYWWSKRNQVPGSIRPPGGTNVTGSGGSANTPDPTGGVVPENNVPTNDAWDPNSGTGFAAIFSAVGNITSSLINAFGGKNEKK